LAGAITASIRCAAARGFLVLAGYVRRDLAVVVRVEDDAVIA
jgi:hypothetical protein